MFRTRRLCFPIVTLLACLATACGERMAGPGSELVPVDLAAPWVVSSPAAEGFDVAALTRAFDRAATAQNIRALVVVRNGKLVREAYFNGATADSAFDLRSVTKTVMALLVGMAADRGLLSADDPISRWLPGDLLSPEHQGIRVRHLLTMTSGIQWSDQASFNPWVQSGRAVGYVLDLPVVAAPGATFIYNSGGSHLLSVIVGRAAPPNALDFAARNFFAPLQFTGWRWPIFPEGDPVGGAALTLRAQDAARVGQLLLQRGRSGIQQIVSQEWVARQTRSQVQLGNAGILRNAGYGYQTWTDGSGTGSIVALGYGGQIIWIVPARNLVVVAIAHWRGVNDYDGHQTISQASVVNEVLAAVR